MRMRRERRSRTIARCNIIQRRDEWRVCPEDLAAVVDSWAALQLRRGALADRTGGVVRRRPGASHSRAAGPLARRRGRRPRRPAHSAKLARRSGARRSGHVAATELGANVRARRQRMDERSTRGLGQLVGLPGSIMAPRVAAALRSACNRIAVTVCRVVAVPFQKVARRPTPTSPEPSNTWPSKLPSSLKIAVRSICVVGRSRMCSLSSFSSDMLLDVPSALV